ncbi:hypothetical protein Agub_g14828, partial [Astrephomene gubernaculifera]
GEAAGGGSLLPAAVAGCVAAAGADLNPLRQRALLRAAAYGRPFCPPSFPKQLMYGVACRLRVLAAVRDPRVGLPLTMAQLEVLGLPVLVARLISYRQWLLAYRIAGVLRNIPGGGTAGPGAGGAGGAAGLGLPATPGSTTPTTTTTTTSASAPPLLGQEAVLLQWACAKISSASIAGGGAAAAAPRLDDGSLKDAIVSRLKGCPGVRFAPLAAHALSVGRRRLALRLLEEERSAAAQVPLLLGLALGGG